MRQEKHKELSVYGKLPPHDKELEMSVLGALIMEPTTVDEVLPILSIDDFYFDQNSRIYNAIVSIVSRGGQLDILILIDQLKRTNELEVVGGPYYLSKLTYGVVSSANLVSWCRIIKELSFRRSLAKISAKIYSESFDMSKDALDMMSSAQVELSSVLDTIKGQQMSKLSDVIVETIMEMEERAKNDSPYLGYRCGLDRIDKVTLGFSGPDFIVIAAGTGEGKSTFALQAAQNIAQGGDPVAIFSLEMKNRQLMWKIFSSIIGEQVKTIRLGKLSDDQWRMLHREIDHRFKDNNIWMHDKGGLSVIELGSIVRTLVLKKGVKIVFIDYLQLLRAGTEKGFPNREAEVNFISKYLKDLAMQLNIPIVALSQLSRMEKGVTRLYKLSDLRESGAIEQDADGVIFIWNPEKHNAMKGLKGGEPFEPGDVLFHIAKWRLGDTGTIKEKWNGAYSRFEDYPDEWSGTTWRPLNEVVMSVSRPLSRYNETEQAEDDGELPF